MPRINRVRIVNFSYNHDSRHIHDETFNFHGGENALLSLANGGGKSVLVQLLLQPVVPGIRIQNRNVAGFFHRKRLPSYIMIEWKLDEAGGYLLTGIAMVSVESPGVEEARNRIRYFTFTSKYTGANAYDIANIPLVSRNGNVLNPVLFRQAREIMSEREKKDPLAFGYFAEDDGERYARHLAGFGIAQDEWRNVIAKINDSEGGLEEIFQKCRNSSQLINDWILKTVEKAMFKNSSEARGLEEMLEKLVREVVENERFIVEKELLGNFLGEFRDQADALAGLLQGLDGQNRLAGQLVVLHDYLTQELDSLKREYENNEAEMEGCKAEQHRVQLEERSHDYYCKQEKHVEALRKLKTAENLKVETDDALQTAKLNGKVMRAARLAEEIHRKRSELAGVEEKLKVKKAQYDTDGMMRRLEYSLKVSLQEALQVLNTGLDSRRKEKLEKERQVEQAREALQVADGERTSLVEEKGRLEERKRHFESYEKEIRRKLGITLRRNILGEMDPAEIQDTRAELDNARAGLAGQVQKLEDGQRSVAARQQDINRELEQLQALYTEEKTSLKEIERDIREYEQKEQEVRGILDKYGFDREIGFDRERRNTAFGQLIKSLKARQEEAVRKRDDVQEALSSLRKGRLHVPEELASLIAGLDISYETGEAYLRNLPPEIRQKMLDSNPILPYAFLMSRTDIDLVAHSFNGMTMRRLVPLIAYEDLKIIVSSQGRLARTTEGIALACLYEGRMFDNDSLGDLIAELEQRNTKALEQLEHYAENLHIAMSDRMVCDRFDYAAGYRYDLSQKKSIGEQRLEEIDIRRAGLAEEKRKLEIRGEELERAHEDSKAALQKAGQTIALFDDFIDKEKEYQESRARLDQVVTGIGELEKRKMKLSSSLEDWQKEIYGRLSEELRRMEHEQSEIQVRYSLYRDATPAELVEGSIAELEERLKALKEEYTGEIGLLEERAKQLAGELVEAGKDLDRLGLKQELYEHVNYDELAAASIQQEIARLKEMFKNRETEVFEAGRAEAAAEMAQKNALDEVKRLGAGGPLPLEEIKGDFELRLLRARLRVRELEENNKSVSGRIQGYKSIALEIEQLVDPADFKPDEDFLPGKDPSVQAHELKQAFLKIKDKNAKAEESLRKKYNGLKTEYREKNVNTDNIFAGLDPLWEKAGTGYDGLYFLWERMSQHAEKLAELIIVYENQLANLERNKKDMVQQSFLHAQRIYEEIQWISDNSRTSLQHRSRPVQMLRIDMQLDSRDAARQRMQEYIDQCILKVREETRLEKREEEVKKTVARLMSSRSLLNVYLGNPNIPVRVFKIDLNMQNSRLKLWEDAVKENSGGEKFVVFFSVLSALMTYTRARAMEAAGAESGTDTRVLLMDNPFGPISSEHLLRPLFDIAKKHRTQLICLSDLKQNSIMNCFNLIYMIKVRTTAIGNKEYLKLEEIIRDESAVHNDEKLEKALFRASDFQQISLFDEI